METGQAIEQPFVSEGQLAHQAALRIIESEEPAAEEAPQPKTENAEPVLGEATESETEDPSQPEIRKHKLTVKAEDGSDIELEVDDDGLKKGFMLEKDYRAKTAQLARAREAEETKVRDAIQAKVGEYEKSLQTLAQVVHSTAAAELKDINWTQLATSDPAEYVRLKAKAEQVDGLLRNIVSEQQKISQQREREYQQEMQMQIQTARETLQSEIPNWSDDLYSKVLKTGLDYGFKQQEVNAITDPRAIKVLHDAMKFRALQNAKPTVEKKVANAPKVIKPGAAEKPDQNAESRNKLMARLRETGNTLDAVAFAKQFLID